MEMRIKITKDSAGYKKLLECKRLPSYFVEGDEVVTDELSYATIFGGKVSHVEMIDAPHLLDFQRMEVNTALTTKRHASLMDCGLGKTPVALAFAHSVAKIGKVLILCPLSVYEQFMRESKRWHGSRLIDLRHGETWESGVAILNYEARRDIDMTGVSGIVLDEASILKNDTGETRNYLCKLAENVEYRLTTSATPAPNDQEEYASQAVFLGLVKSAKEFYGRFFRKEGNSWVLKGWAVNRFYEYLSTWATYIKSPSALGFDCMTEMQEEPDYIFKRCEVDHDWNDSYDTAKKGENINLFQTAEDGRYRSKVFGKIRCQKDSERTKSIMDFIDGKRSIIWCSRNAEDEMFGSMIPNSVIVNGAMDIEKRIVVVDKWRNGEIDHIISKPSVLGFGINLPESDVMVFSGYTYSFEQFYQAVRRSHRYGRRGRLRVLVPYTFPELPILNSLREKMATFEKDVAELQSKITYKRKPAGHNE